jgi:hypothetical protein
MAFVWIGVMLLIPLSYWFRRSRGRRAIRLERERLRALEYQEELLKRECRFLRKWMAGAPIDAYTSASVPKTFGERANALAIAAAKSVDWAALGVRARFRGVRTPCYVVLSGEDLYFFGTDANGNLDQRSVIDGPALGSATLRPSSDGDLTHYELTFEVEGKPLAIEIHDRLSAARNFAPVFRSAYSRALLKYRLVGDRFFEVLAERFPNLSPG